MAAIPLQALVPAFPRLPPLRLKRLLREMGKEGADSVSPGEGLLLWLAHWMAVTQPVTVDQQELILTEMGKEIIAYGDTFAEKMSTEKSIPAAVISILDRSFAIISGREAFLVLDKGTYVKGLVRAPRESLSYNLAGMYADVCGATAPKRLNQPQERGTMG